MKNLKLKNNIKIIGFMGCVIFLSACGNQTEQKKQYEEVHIKASKPLIDKYDSHDSHVSMKGSDKADPFSNINMQQMTTKSSVSWEAPEGWEETKGSGMRLVTFRVNPPNPIECAIISLDGMGGELEANVVRWMGQIGSDTSEEQKKAFLSALKETRTPTKLPITIINFTKLQKDEDDFSPSMIVAIIKLEDKTLFVKMTGDKASILENKEKFQSLWQSIKRLQ